LLLISTLVTIETQDAFRGGIISRKRIWKR